MAFLFTVAIALLIDLYVYKGIRLMVAGYLAPWKMLIAVTFWGITIIVLGGLAKMVITYRPSHDPAILRDFFFFFTLFVVAYVPKLMFVIFHLADDISFLAGKLFNTPPLPGENISRGAFLTRMGFFASMLPAGYITYGVVRGKYNFKVFSEKIAFTGLPKAFNNLRIVQVSDFHIGSFADNHAAVRKGIELVNMLEPDILLFTGDLVNNHARETDGWMEVLGGMNAKLGKYAILGNHDYGDYIEWESAHAKAENLRQVKDFIRRMGFRLLLNENITVNHNGEELTLIGVENWGRPPFHKYGDLQKAMTGVKEDSFKILMSHDPAHWEDEVMGKNNIHLTFAGHTHGMQFGVEVGAFKWSPVKYRYPRWAGLYREGGQCLYVNRGFGFIGFEGRVGILPEITMIELQSAPGIA